MKVLTGAVVLGMVWWGAASVVDDSPLQLEPPVVELEAGPIAGPGAPPAGAFCPLERHSRSCQWRSAESPSPSVLDHWRRWRESRNRWLAEIERQMLNATGYPRIAGRRS